MAVWWAKARDSEETQESVRMSKTLPQCKLGFCRTVHTTRKWSTWSWWRLTPALKVCHSHSLVVYSWSKFCSVLNSVKEKGQTPNLAQESLVLLKSVKFPLLHYNAEKEEALDSIDKHLESDVLDQISTQRDSYDERGEVLITTYPRGRRRRSRRRRNHLVFVTVCRPFSRSLQTLYEETT